MSAIRGLSPYLGKIRYKALVSRGRGTRSRRSRILAVALQNIRGKQ